MIITRPSKRTSLLATALVVLFSAGAQAAPLSKDQQTCVNALNKAGAKVAATQGKENSGCIKAGGSENLDNPTTDACIAADNKGKVSGAQQKTTDAQSSKCSGTPPYGYSGAAITNAAAESEEVALVQSVFGNPVHPNVLTDSAGAKCQASVAKALEKLGATRMKSFNACKKDGFKTGSITTGAGINACINYDPKQKVDGAAAKLAAAVTDQCAGVTLATAFPGCAAEAPTMADCIERKVECHMCLFANAMDALSIPCDLEDDGVVNQTCRQCGNSLQEAPEACDTGGDSVSCDVDCTAPACGDGHLNAAASETCDDGNNATTDPCVNCAPATCGDGFVCSGAGCTTGPNGGVEACDDGDNINGNGCDNNCSVSACGNGITAPDEDCDDGNAINTDTCTNACNVATCGDGITCSAVGCTSGPTGGVEACDDADLDNTDNCLNTCAAASCGDGFLCNGGGCTSGPFGGNEQCDNAGSNSNVTPDACRTNCRTAYCGDGVDDTADGCDDGNLVNSDACLNTCVVATCGDGVTCTAMSCTSGPTGGAEACDDADLDNTDNCLNTCAAATCGDGFLCNGVGCTSGPSGGAEQCDNAGANSNVTPDACRTNCRTAFCGDNVTDAGETCDSGAVNTASCDSNCTSAACGDGFINTANMETCDGGGETATCDTNCTAAICGDSTINATKGENCDDGNAMSGDGCSSTCLTGQGSGEQDQACPNLGELTLYSKTSNEVCANNGDCTEPRFCDTTTSRCVTVADLDSGWNGSGHDADINDQVKAMAYLLCEGPAGPDCGECEVLGLSPDAGNCRCANSVLTKCDQPFAADANDCGGAVCNCYFGAPFPLVAQGTPVCVSNRFSQNISGTANVDLGAGQITARLRTQVFSGLTTDMPCPVCGGKCSNDNSGCIFDADCTMGATCVQDTPGDGIRNGVCVRDPDFHNGDGTACDVDGSNASFPGIVGDSTPGQGGAGYSIDCQPLVGANISGQGLSINLSQTTGTASLSFGVDCDANGAGTALCPCLSCSGDTSVPCSSNAECGALAGNCSLATTGGGFACDDNADCTPANLGPCNNLGRCTKRTAALCSNNADCVINAGPCALQTCTATGSAGVVPEPNNCVGGICTDEGGGEGTCASGPTNLFCDGLVRADGTGINPCLANADCVGGYGACTLADPADCFLDPIVAQGNPDPDFPIAAAAFCIPATANNTVNDAAGLPGPGRVVSQGAAKTYCASDNNTQYTPGGTPACP